MDNWGREWSRRCFDEVDVADRKHTSEVFGWSYSSELTMLSAKSERIRDGHEADTRFDRGYLWSGRRNMSRTAQSNSTPNTDEAGDTLRGDATSAAANDDKQDNQESGTEQVADKQLYRWKDDGGALPPQKY